jgi:hypothetical protein
MSEASSNNGTSDTPWSESELKHQIKLKGAEVGSCFLDQSVFFGVGLAVGSAVSLRFKSVRPFVYGVAIGTIGDAVYAYGSKCRDIMDELNACKQALVELEKRQ